MVWWVVSWHGVTRIHFCVKGVKTGTRVYHNTVLNSLAKPLSDSLFEGIDWVLGFIRISHQATKQKQRMNGLKTIFQIL
jgi:hypothetical protein